MTQTDLGSCEDCVFADISKCLIGLETVVIGEEDYKLVPNARPCYFKRLKTWSKYDEKKSYDELRAIARKELERTFDAIIYLGPEGNIEDLEKTIDSLNEQEQPHKNILVCFLYNTHSPSTIIDSLKTRLKGQGWRTEVIVNDELDDNGIVDLMCTKVKSDYYTVLEAGETLPKDFNKKIDEAVVDRRKCVYLVYMLGEDGEKRKITMDRQIHSYILGNQQLDVVNKLMLLEKQHNIFEYSTL